MLTPMDIMRDKDVALLAGLKTATFQQKMKKGFGPDELDWRLARPVKNGRERIWLRQDVERIWRKRLTAGAGAPAGEEGEGEEGGKDL